MRNEDRQVLLAMIMGDGNLYCKGPQHRITLCHANTQLDWLTYKAERLSDIFDKDVKVRPTGNPNASQAAVNAKYLRILYGWYYPHNRKSKPTILKDSTDPQLLFSYWLLDDGAVTPNSFKKKDGSKSYYGGMFRLFVNACSAEEAEACAEWVRSNFQVQCRVKWIKRNQGSFGYNGQPQPYLAIPTQDSLKIWTQIREFVLQFPSMQHKFRHIENHYQKKHSALAVE